MRSRVAIAVLAIATAGALSIGIWRDALLPARFSFDARFIQHLAQTARAERVDRSFSNTAGLYRALGLQDAPTAVGVLTILLLAAVTSLAVLRSAPRLPLSAATIGAASIVLGAVYLGTYSKDAPVLLVSLALVTSGRGVRWEAAVLGTIAGYALLFRSYWFLILAVFILLRVVRRLVPRWWIWLVGAALALVLMATAIAAVLHVPPDHFRTAVNLGRVGDVDARTMLRPLLPGPEPLAGFVNVLAAMPMLIVPIPLVAMGGSYYIAVAALIATLWGAFWFGVMRIERGRASTPEVRRAVAFIISFLVVQAFFEPDYGSALRHLTPLLAVFTFVIADAVTRRPHSDSLKLRTRLAGTPV